MDLLVRARKALTDNDDGLVFYRRFAQIIKYILKPKGSFYCEIGKSNTCNEIEKIFKKNNYTINWIFDLNIWLFSFHSYSRTCWSCVS